MQPTTTIATVPGNSRAAPWVYALLLLAIGYFVIVQGYEQPANVFWDENYYLASAYKTLQGVFYMEPHPPLGKLFIALGEALLHPNRHLDTRYFLSTDYVRSLPEGFSFAGVRLFPVLFAWLGVPLYFLVLLELSRRPGVSFLITSCYLFENALVVHNRAAMLDSCLLFFSLLALWRALRMGRGRAAVRDFLGLGVLVGCAWATKLNTIVLLLLCLLPFVHQPNLRKGWTALSRTVAFLGGAGAMFCLVFYLHIALGRHVVEGSTYTASARYLQLVREEEAWTPRVFPGLLREQLAYIPHYHQGVPTYDETKAGENGSPPYLWPLGKKAINYRWDQDGGRVRYTYLQVNPVSWYAGLVGVVLALILVGGRLFYRLPVADVRLFRNAAFLFLLYGSYMLMVLSQDRVMYLYHYFLPVLVSHFLLFTAVLYLLADRLERHRAAVAAGFAVFALADFGAFLFFSPLTYHRPLTTAQFQQRNWLRIWGMAPVECAPAAPAPVAILGEAPASAVDAGDYRVEKITDPVLCLRLAAGKGDQNSVDHYLEACVKAGPEAVESLRAALAVESNRAVAKMLAYALLRMNTPESLRALQEAVNAVTNAEVSDVIQMVLGYPAQPAP